MKRYNKLSFLFSVLCVFIFSFTSKAQLDDKKEIIVVTGKGDISYEKGKKIPVDPVFKDTVKISAVLSRTCVKKYGRFVYMKIGNPRNIFEKNEFWFC